MSLPGHHEDERKSTHLVLGPASPQPCHLPYVPSATGREAKQRNDDSGLVASPLLSMLGAGQPEPRQKEAEGIREKLLEGRANGVGVGMGWGPSTVAAGLTGHPRRSHLKDLVNPYIIIP